MCEEILTLNITLQETTRRTKAMIEQRSESDAARDEIMGELTTKNEELGTEITEHNERIRTLTSESKRLDDAMEGPMIQWRLTHGSKMYPETGKQSVSPINDCQAHQVLHMFYNGYDLSGMCTITNLAPSEIFRLLQTLVPPPSSRVPGNMKGRWNGRSACQSFLMLSGTLDSCFPHRFSRAFVPAGPFWKRLNS
jgi:hypothetical protein